MAAVISGILYRKNNSDDLSSLQTKLLATFRFLVVFIISILILAPVLELYTKSVEDPIIVFVDDNSESIELAYKDNDYLKNYDNRRDELLDLLRQDYQVQEYVFGESFRRKDTVETSDKLTDMSVIFQGINDFYSNRNVGAVILASDGIYNQGVNPVYFAREMQFPVYTVALGDTLIKRDLSISKVSHNDISYLGNLFPVEIVVEARKSDGSSSKLSISKNGENVFSKIITFSSDHDFENVLVELEAQKTGIQKYEISIAPLDNESNLDNNKKEFFIDVIDSRQKILILADSPHPDIGAIKQTIEDNENYEISHQQISEFEESTEAYNLIIFHQLPSKRISAHPVISEVINSNIPVLFIVGANTNLIALSNLNAGMAIQQRSGEYNNAQAALNQSFSLFSISSEVEKLSPLMPPLYSPFAVYKTTPATNTFIFQKIGNVKTDDPLIAFSDISGKKYGFICGEGLWRWRLNNFLREKNHNYFNEIILKIVQYLSVKEDKSLFRISTQNLVYENEAVTFEAELYNASYELINEPEVSLTITDESGNTFDYEFSRTSNAYILDAGTFSPGNYSYKAKTLVGNETFEAKGEISVAELNLEAINTVANHSIMYRIANESDAEMVYPDNMNELAESIKNRDDIRGLIYMHTDYSELINWKSLFFVILILLAVEWFIRKRSGNY
ncbi:MAG: hypothetical protein ACOCWC_01310 [Bacteroidota bacterium]